VGWKSTRRTVVVAAALLALSGTALSLTGGAQGRVAGTALSTPVAIAGAPDGSIWVADSVGILRVTPQGQMSRVLEEPQVVSLAPGPGGMWFTERLHARIGRIGADGHVDYFSEGVTTAASSITAGADGNMWFAEDAPRIGRITPTGVVDEFSSGLHRDSALAALTPGPDGNVWFADYHGFVGRITTTGAITEFRVPEPAGGGPGAITSGPHQTLWFPLDNRVGRMTTRGRLRIFRIPLDLTSGVAKGADGNIWVTGYRDVLESVARIVRVTPSGRVHTFSRGFSGASTEAITRAGDGNLWLTESGRSGDHLARVTREGSVTEFPPTPPCRVPQVKRLTLLAMKAVAYNSLCRIDRASARAGSRRHTIALGVRPPAGTILPFDTQLHVRFGPVPPLPRTCSVPFGGRRLAETSKVLAVSYTDYSSDGLGTSTKYDACRRPRGRLERIDASADDLLEYSNADGFKIAGRFVVYRYFSESHYNDSVLSLKIFDLRQTGPTFGVDVETHAGDFGPDPPDNPVLVDYALSPHGALAWLVKSGDVLYLKAHGSSSGTRSLDSGDLSALSFSGDVLSWTSGGQTKTAEVR
jgi:virginiamycin B lyase